MYSITRGLESTALETAPLETVPIAPQLVMICLIWLIVATRRGFYISRRTDSLRSEVVDLLETVVVTLGAGCLLPLLVGQRLAFDPLMTLLVFTSGILFLRLTVRLWLRRLRGKGLNYRKVVLVGRGSAADAFADRCRQNPHYGIRLVGSFELPGEEAQPPAGVDCMGSAATLTDAVVNLGVDAVVLCPDRRVTSEHISSILETCDVAGIHCVYAPEFLTLKNLTSSTTMFGGMPAFTFNTRIGSPIELAIKRAIDITGALCGLIISLPVIFGVALAIKLSDRGPIFFRQVRIGKGGRRFSFFKFRSMRMDAEARKIELEDMNEVDGPVFKIRKDPRVTAVGRFIRKYSLDELPQLLNVLKGDMSLVGPRPPVPSEVVHYSWWQRRRISVRPGLTCVWQVKGRNTVSFDEWIEMDLFYIDNWSLWMDLKLMMQTMPAVVRGTGT